MTDGRFLAALLAIVALYGTYANAQNAQTGHLEIVLTAVALHEPPKGEWPSCIITTKFLNKTDYHLDQLTIRLFQSETWDREINFSNIPANTFIEREEPYRLSCSEALSLFLKPRKEFVIFQCSLQSISEGACQRLLQMRSAVAPETLPPIDAQYAALYAAAKARSDAK